MCVCVCVVARSRCGRVHALFACDAGRSCSLAHSLSLARSLSLFLALALPRAFPLPLPLPLPLARALSLSRSLSFSFSLCIYIRYMPYLLVTLAASGCVPRGGAPKKYENGCEGAVSLAVRKCGGGSEEVTWPFLVSPAWCGSQRTGDALFALMHS